MLGLLVAGLVVLIVGLLAIGFGIPVKEFSFGNTLILSGVLGACTGAVLVAFWLILRELRGISLALNPARQASAGRQRGESDPFAAQSAGVAVSGDAGSPREGSAAAPETPAPWQDEFAARDRSRPPGPPIQDAAAAPAPLPEPPVKKRRNLLFMSSKRDREQTAGDPSHAEIETPEIELQTPASAPQVSFEDAWPAADRQRPDPLRRMPRSAGAAESDDARTAAAPPPPIRRPAESPPVTILKSGVVDGMAYSLYSDGSIEAQMPEGMIRFASIDELRTHLDQRS
jgi:hypothetical protein